MPNLIVFIKQLYFSERIIFDARIFLNLSEREFDLISSAIFIIQIKNSKTKTFSNDDLFKMLHKLTGKNYIKKPPSKTLSDLIKKEYFIAVGNKRHNRAEVVYYALNKKKIEYFLSALSTFIELSLQSVADVNEQIEVSQIAKEDVLKHIKGLETLFKFR
jgi:hypothetical protein